jgi:hypothetical protein
MDAKPEDAFATLDQLVRRQELLAKNRLAADTHWTRIRRGYQWSTLEKTQDKDEYRATMPPGVDRLGSPPSPTSSMTCSTRSSRR